MIICPQCQSGSLEEFRNGLSCTKCHVKYLYNNDILFFHPDDMDSNEGLESCIFDDLLKYENNHFWTSSRRYFIKNIIMKYCRVNESIMEIGAGTCYIAKYLNEIGYYNYSIGDINKKSLEFAPDHFHRRKYQFNLVKNTFIEHFDAVCMFDVLEHIDDNDKVVKNIYKMLKKDGKVIITVPAHQWLWSKQDHIAYHRKRYEVKQLRELFLCNNFNILKVNAFFFSLIPFMYLRKILNRDSGIINENDFKERFKTNIFVNIFFKTVLFLEISLFNNYSSNYGGSILLVAKK